MWFVLIIGLITALFSWDYLHKRRRKQIFKKNGFRGPSLWPILGGGHHFANETLETLLHKLSEFLKDYGKTFSIWVLHEGTVSTADVKFIEPILSSQQVIAKNRLYDLLRSWLGTGLLLSTGRKWHSRRKIITPTFHFKILEQFVEVFDQQSAIMVQKLYAKADGKTIIDMFPIACLTALDIIAETAMGVKVNAQIDPDFPYVKAVKTVTEITAVRFSKPHQRFDSLMRWFAPREFKKLADNIDLMHKFTDGVIRERRTLLQQSIAAGEQNIILGNADNKADDDDTDCVLGSKKRLALLDVLLQSSIAGQALSNEDIREEVDTFMFEGHDTTTSGIAHTLYLIARHPVVQEKLFLEIRALLGDDKHKPITMRQLQEMKYLECVIKESLRLYPPVPMIGRHVQEDVVLNGKLFPANTNIVVLIFHAMRDPDYFDEPTTFKPERFGPDSNIKIDPFSYVPFSAGPRNCIGQKFAILEMKSTISKMLRHYELLPLGPEVRPMLNVVLRSANGCNLGLKPRVY